jgi:hypothetical protein
MDRISSRFKYLVQKNLDSNLTLAEHNEYKALITESEQA